MIGMCHGLALGWLPPPGGHLYGISNKLSPDVISDRPANNAALRDQSGMAWSEFRDGMSLAQRARTTGKEDPQPVVGCVAEPSTRSLNRLYEQVRCLNWPVGRAGGV
ncbi:MAG: hypothetical protein ACI8Y4_005567, partial [Candidatus Poriferisodalaceae bacterium]